MSFTKNTHTKNAIEFVHWSDFTARDFRGMDVLLITPIKKGVVKECLLPYGGYLVTVETDSTLANSRPRIEAVLEYHIAGGIKRIDAVELKIISVEEGLITINCSR